MLETLDIAREYGMTYSSDLYDDDRPYFMKTNEKGDQDFADSPAVGEL